MLPANGSLIQQAFDAFDVKYLSDDQARLHALVARSNSYAKLVYVKPYILKFEKDLIDLTFERVPYNKEELYNAFKHCYDDGFLTKVKYAPANTAFVKCRLCNEVSFDNYEDKKKHFFGWCEPVIDLLLSSYDCYTYETNIRNYLNLKTVADEVKAKMTAVTF